MNISADAQYNVAAHSAHLCVCAALGMDVVCVDRAFEDMIHPPHSEEGVSYHRLGCQFEGQGMDRG